MLAAKRPAAHNTGYGTPVSFGAGAWLTSVKYPASSRSVSGPLVGTCQALPHACSLVAAVTSMAATSLIEVQLCGTSSGIGAYARRPASSGLPSATEKIELAW